MLTISHISAKTSKNWTNRCMSTQKYCTGWLDQESPQNRRKNFRLRAIETSQLKIFGFHDQYRRGHHESTAINLGCNGKSEKNTKKSKHTNPGDSLQIAHQTCFSLKQRIMATYQSQRKKLISCNKSSLEYSFQCGCWTGSRMMSYTNN